MSTECQSPTIMSNHDVNIPLHAGIVLMDILSLFLLSQGDLCLLIFHTTQLFLLKIKSSGPQAMKHNRPTYPLSFCA